MRYDILDHFYIVGLDNKQLFYGQQPWMTVPSRRLIQKMKRKVNTTILQFLIPRFLQYSNQVQAWKNDFWLTFSFPKKRNVTPPYL